ncbi:hypothetical protein GLIP_0040 [Aliiglaciecola lipolytica E3]|uniref:Uncharacterized protein n=1 Tax=Aliiglaciecola lipolytica E3 TaxID=1127673 RepID=K6YMW8_9ALTE|nr:hypothetical protein GLIP_0040 [Aliiglaciecola lipolytica E3]
MRPTLRDFLTLAMNACHLKTIPYFSAFSTLHILNSTMFNFAY